MHPSKALTSPIVSPSHASYGIYGQGVAKTFAGEQEFLSVNDGLELARGLQQLNQKVAHMSNGGQPPRQPHQFANVGGQCQVVSGPPGPNTYSSMGECKAHLQ